MLSITNLTYYIGGRTLYENASLHISANDKIGLIGLNGSGKTTLLRLITGEYTPDGGEISKSSDCSIGFLNQDLLSYQSAESILSVAMQAFEEALSAQRKIDRLIEKIEKAYTPELVEELTHLQDLFETMGGYTIQSRAEEILEGIGFSTADLNRPLQEFSGGWRMRVMLAKLLLEQPSLLMLDEPTNHLDLPSIQWVENYLKNYNGAVLIVSHDQKFLNNSVNKIVEVDGYELTVYEGNYDFYLEEKALRNEIRQNAYRNQQQKIKQTERFINRFRAKATKARQVQSRIKSLERLDRVQEVADDSPQVDISFKINRQPGKTIVELQNVSQAYGDLELFRNTSATIRRGDKIALIGANGKGKSTLLRIITGREAVAGKVEEGYNVKYNFFAQHQLEALTLDNEILEELKQAGSGKPETELRTILGCFLFTGDDVYKKIKTLSGGEKSRVALAKTLISEANFLILDEPTNHLDIQSVNILIQALQTYEGSFIMVSHDRRFISETANKIWYIENKEIKEYPGTYDEYEYASRQKSRNVDKIKIEERKEKPAATRQPVSPDNAAFKEKKRLLQQREKEFETLEAQIIDLEGTISEIETNLADPAVYEDADKLTQLNTRYQEVQNQLDDAQEKWAHMAEEIESLAQEVKR